MAPQPAKKAPRTPQVGKPDTGSKRDVKHPETPEEGEPTAGPDVDRPGQGDDEMDRKNQADGHHDTAERRERLTKSGRLKVTQIKRVLEETDKGNQ